MARRADGIVGVEDGLDGPLTDELAVDASDDPVACHISQHFVFEVRRRSTAFADQVAVKPLLGDALELAEEVKLGVFASSAPFAQDQVGR